MGWGWSFADTIPVVGHVKGLYHYTTGDVESGNKCMRESTRSTVVMGAGAVGGIAGPGGAVGLAMSTGALWDSVETVARDKPTGLIAGVDNIVNTSKRGKVPSGGLVQTALSLGGDALGGLGGSGIASSFSNAASSTAAKSVGKSASESASKQILKSATYDVGETFGKSISRSAVNSFSKSVGKSVSSTMMKEATKKMIQNEAVIILSHGTTRALAKEKEEMEEKRNVGRKSSGSSNRPPPNPSPNSQRQQTSGKKTSSSGNATGSSGDGGQPPRKNSNKKNARQQQDLHWDEFLRIFGVKSAADIEICGQYLFEGLERGQEKTLKKKIRLLGNNGHLPKVIATIRNIFNTFPPESVTFQNFLCLIEFVIVYLNESMARRAELDSQRGTKSFQERMEEFVRIVGETILRHDYTIVNVFQKIRALMEPYMTTLPINFRNIFAAVYHYYKHRFLREYEFGVEEYVEIIKKLLQIMLKLKAYKDLVRAGVTVIKFEIYYDRYGRRFRIVVKKIDDDWELSTGYFIDDCFDDDQDGDMFLNDKKITGDYVFKK